MSWRIDFCYWRSNLAKNKRYNRLAYLESKASSHIKAERIPYVCIPAFSGESDLEAVSKRFAKPSYNNYKIEVIRRDGKNIEVNYYDQALQHLSGLVYPHPSSKDALQIFLNQVKDDDATRAFTICDLNLLYDLYDSALASIDCS